MDAVAASRPLSLPVAAWRVARLAPFRVLRGKRLVGLGLLALAPVLIVAGVLVAGAEHGTGVRHFVDFVSHFWLSAIVPVTLLFLGAGAVGDDVDNATFLYLRLRPIPRAAIVLGRFAATWASAMALFAPVLALQYALQVGVRDPALAVEELAVLGSVLLVVGIASMAYTALFLLLALTAPRAIVFGLIFIAGWEQFVSRIPSGAAFATVRFHASAQLSRMTSEGNAIDFFLRPFHELDLVPDLVPSMLGVIVASAVLLALASRSFAKREYLNLGE